MKYFNISIKQKSLLFILLLISILLVTLYFQNSTSYRNYLYLLQSSYQTSINTQYKSFNNHLLSSYENISMSLKNSELESYIKNRQIEKLEQQTNELSSLLKPHNPYLQKIKILKIDKQAYQNPMKIITIKEKPYYEIIFPLSQSWVIKYLIDINILSSYIKEFDGSDSFLFLKNKEVHSSIESNHEIEIKMLNCCTMQQKNLININNKFYVSNLIPINNGMEEKDLKILFYSDVTKEKLSYISTIRKSMLTSILLFIFAAIVVNYFFGVLIKTINKNEEKLKDINHTLEQRVTSEINERMNIQKIAHDEKQKNEQLLIQQSKLAMMGEMIGNIAHQWRQPLMQLSAIIMYLDAYNEKEKLTKEKFQNKITESVSIIDYMSKTIEDFRNYYKPEKQKEEFLIKQSINSALFIIDSALKNSFIKVKINYEDENLKIKSFKNEFSQAILNVISNAKDVLIQRKIKNPQINILVYSKNEKSYIAIEDNGNGINKDILDKIFDPYFTTKHKSQGTGIGLYMTKMIIENNMQGKIEVINTKNGAQFTIIL